MSAFDSEHVARVERCLRRDGPSRAVGTALEDLAASIFAAVPGVQVRARNAVSVFDNEEFDLVLANRSHPRGLSSAGAHFSVECKNWTRPVGSMEVAWFATKLRRSAQRFGVLIAAQGVTGRERDLTAAHFEAAAALGEGQAIVILTLAEISWLTSGEQLAQILEEKFACLVARREVKIFTEGELPASEPPVRLATTPAPPAKKEALIERLAMEVSRDPALLRTVGVSLDNLWPAVDAFDEHEAREPSGGGDDDPHTLEQTFNVWSEQSLVVMERVADALRRLGAASIAGLRAGTAKWSTERLVLGVELQAPANLNAPPDSPLARMILGEWRRAADEPVSWKRDPALLCLLGWAADWLIAIDEERWPPPWV